MYIYLSLIFFISSWFVGYFIVLNKVDFIISTLYFSPVIIIGLTYLFRRRTLRFAYEYENEIKLLGPFMRLFLYIFTTRFFYGANGNRTMKAIYVFCFQASLISFYISFTIRNGHYLSSLFFPHHHNFLQVFFFDLLKSFKKINQNELYLYLVQTVKCSNSNKKQKYYLNGGVYYSFLQNELYLYRYYYKTLSVPMYYNTFLRKTYRTLYNFGKISLLRFNAMPIQLKIVLDNNIIINKIVKLEGRWIGTGTQYFRLFGSVKLNKSLKNILGFSLNGNGVVTLKTILNDAIEIPCLVTGKGFKSRNTSKKEFYVYVLIAPLKNVYLIPLFKEFYISGVTVNKISLFTRYYKPVYPILVKTDFFINGQLNIISNLVKMKNDSNNSVVQVVLNGFSYFMTRSKEDYFYSHRWMDYVIKTYKKIYPNFFFKVKRIIIKQLIKPRHNLLTMRLRKNRSSIGCSINSLKKIFSIILFLSFNYQQLKHNYLYCIMSLLRGKNIYGIVSNDLIQYRNDNKRKCLLLY